MKIKKRYLLLVPLLLAAPPAIALSAMEPSNDRDWTPDIARMAVADVQGDRVRVQNVRNTSYVTRDSFTVAWETREYDVAKLRRAWFMVEPFSRDFQGPAHTLVSFEFEGGQFVAVSVEIRKEKGESYSPWAGLLNRYELQYVVADERDVLGLRAIHRGHDVYLYPIRAEREKVRAVFLDMMARANQLRERPEFYNTATSTCTTNLVDHVNRITPRRIHMSWRILLPGYADKLAYDVGMIDTELPFEQARERYRINDRVKKYAAAPDFSVRIRGEE